MGLVWSPWTQNQRVFDGLFHNSDILPTLASAAGIKIDPVDGFDQWNALLNGGKSPRKEVVSVLDNIAGYSAIISDTWKLVNGTSSNGQYDSYLGKIQEFSLSPDTYSNLIISSMVGKVLTDPNATKAQKINLTPAKINNLRKKLTISCKEADNPIVKCNPLKKPCLYSIIDDPCERKNLADTFPATTSKLVQRMNDLVRMSDPERRTFVSDPRCDPALHLGTWDWWIADNAL